MRPNPHSWKEASLAMQSCIFTCTVAQLNSSYVSHEQCQCMGLLSPGNCGQGDVFLYHIWQYAISLFIWAMVCVRACVCARVCVCVCVCVRACVCVSYV